MITLTIMVAFCALLGTIALAMMFPTGIQKEFLANGAYEAFRNVGIIMALETCLPISMQYLKHFSI